MLKISILQEATIKMKVFQDKIHLTIGLALSNDGHEAKRSLFPALPACIEYKDIELVSETINQNTIMILSTKTL